MSAPKLNADQLGVLLHPQNIAKYLLDILQYFRLLDELSLSQKAQLKLYVKLESSQTLSSFSFFSKDNIVIRDNHSAFSSIDLLEDICYDLLSELANFRPRIQIDPEEQEAVIIDLLTLCDCLQQVHCALTRIIIANPRFPIWIKAANYIEKIPRSAGSPKHYRYAMATYSSSDLRHLLERFFKKCRFFKKINISEDHYHTRDLSLPEYCSIVSLLLRVMSRPLGIYLIKKIVMAMEQFMPDSSINFYMDSKFSSCPRHIGASRKPIFTPEGKFSFKYESTSTHEHKKMLHDGLMILKINIPINLSYVAGFRADNLGWTLGYKKDNAGKLIVSSLFSPNYICVAHELRHLLNTIKLKNSNPKPNFATELVENGRCEEQWSNSEEYRTINYTSASENLFRKERGGLCRMTHSSFPLELFKSEHPQEAAIVKRWVAEMEKLNHTGIIEPAFTPAKTILDNIKIKHRALFIKGERRQLLTNFFEQLNEFFINNCYAVKVEIFQPSDKVICCRIITLDGKLLLDVIYDGAHKVNKQLKITSCVAGPYQLFNLMPAGTQEMEDVLRGQLSIVLAYILDITKV